MSESRWVPLAGASNVRDLGGLPLRGGGTTRFGRLLRSDTLQELTAGDVDHLRALGLRTIIDLRTPVEAEREGRGPLADEAIDYANLPFVPDAVIVSDDPRHEVVVAERRQTDRVEHYLDYLRLAPTRVVAALDLLAASGAAPALFHCAAGKDRTGVLAALVLEIAGVERAAVLDDYALTNERGEQIDARLRRLATYRRYLSSVRPEDLRADRSTMDGFLARVDADWGGAAGWAAANGLSPAASERLRDLLTG